MSRRHSPNSPRAPLSLRLAALAGAILLASGAGGCAVMVATGTIATTAGSVAVRGASTAVSVGAGTVSLGAGAVTSSARAVTGSGKNPPEAPHPQQ